MLQYFDDFLSLLHHRKPVRTRPPVVSAEEARDHLVSSIKGLGPRERYVLIQLHIARRSRTDILSELGISRACLDKLLIRALRKCRSRFEASGGELNGRFQVNMPPPPVMAADQANIHTPLPSEDASERVLPASWR